MSETKLATERFGTQSDVIDDTEILNLLESYHREYINITSCDKNSAMLLGNLKNHFYMMRFFEKVQNPFVNGSCSVDVLQCSSRPRFARFYHIID